MTNQTQTTPKPLAWYSPRHGDTITDKQKTERAAYVPLDAAAYSVPLFTSAPVAPAGDKPATSEPAALIRTWHKDGEQHAELCFWCDIGDLHDGLHKLYAAPPDVQRDAERAAINALLHQIDIGDFVDSNGHSAKMLKPVHDLLRLMATKVST